ncbi:MAG TPA: protein kinase [Polyangia bacterium]|jgi:serine/threonine protein kinase|nr:protein kinase [Polyangia bacterium]
MEDSGSGALVQDSSAFDGLIGTTVANNFRLIKRIGSGAMGRVYQAEQLSLGKMVAIKILRHELMADEKLVRRFEQEARTASAVSHPNLIETFDCGRDAALDLAYIAMELLPGPDLSLVIAREAPLSLPRCARIIDQVLAALEEAHAKGIVHRDLKPGNIMLVPRRDDPDFVKVCDFGIAKVKNQGRLRPNLTMAGLVFGTPEYMSPEQACGGEIDARTDLYAVGAILYQMVTGHLPFPAPSATEVLARILRDEPERPSQRAFTVIPDAIENLILRAMSKEREKRPQSAGEFRIALREAWSGHMEWTAINTALPTMSLRGTVTPAKATPIGPKTPSPSSERPTPRAIPVVSASTRTPPSATPPGPALPQPHPPGGHNSNGGYAPRPRRPARAVILGFSLTIVGGGIALLIMILTRGAAPEALVAPPLNPMVADMPAGGGMIVVPTAPPARSAGSVESRRNGPARASAVRRDPRATARLPSHIKNSRHLYDPRESGAPQLVAEPAIASRTPAPVSGDPGLPPPAAPSLSAPAATSHKLRITSIPSDAQVSIDGKVVGRTPLFGAEIDMSAPRQLAIRKDGYILYKQIITASSEWSVRPSDPTSVTLRISALLKPGDPTLAQSRAGATP